MKKPLLTVFSVILACCFLLSACTGGGGDVTPEPAGTADAGPSSDPASDPSAGPAGPTAAPGDMSYDPETDADNLYSAANAALIDYGDGFYWSSVNSYYLLYYDNALEEVIPVCGRPECEHFPGNNVAVQNFGCDAYLEAARSPALYNGKIWYIDYNGKPDPNVEGARRGGLRLFRMNPDGTGKEFVKNIYTVGYGSPQWIILHRGYLYGMSVETNVEMGEVTGKTSVIAVPLEGDETTFKTIYEVESQGWGSMHFIGDYCYFWIRYNEGYEYINWDTGENVDETVPGGVAGRWNSKTDTLEILYRELLTDGESFYDKSWVDRDGTIYVSGTQGLMKLENGEFTVVQSFDDPEKRFVIENISNGVVIARTVPDDFRDPYGKQDLWICRFDGTTVYKGELPLDWYRESPEFTELPGDPGFPSIVMIAGDETGFWCEFTARWWGPDDLVRADYLVRFDITEGGLLPKLYGTFDYIFTAPD